MKMLAVDSWVQKVLQTRDLKPLRARPWFARLQNLPNDWANQLVELGGIRDDILADSGFRAAREDVWRRATYDQLCLVLKGEGN